LAERKKLFERLKMTVRGFLVGEATPRTDLSVWSRALFDTYVQLASASIREG